MPLAKKVACPVSEKGSGLSAALQEAQHRLYLLRQQRKESGNALDQSRGAAPSPAWTAPLPTQADSIEALPPHLGWGSVPLTAVMRAACQRQQRREAQAEAPLNWLVPPDSPTPPSEPPPCPSPSKKDHVKLHADIATGMLRQSLAAPGRIWLLLRHLDAAGQGWLDVADVRTHLSSKGSALRVCGWRQLRNLMRQGEGIFWQRQRDRLWLRSVAKTAAALNVWRLTGAPVAIPISVLTQSIGVVRAHLYASFHSGRAVGGHAKGKSPKPIARQSLRAICHISRRTQRIYERTAKVQKQQNYAVGPQLHHPQAQELAWTHGPAAFQLTDHAGKHGLPGRKYLAWQLPNNYFGPHDQKPRGRQKRINHQLSVLFTQGMTGNGKAMIEGNAHYHPKRFFGSGHTAAKAYNRSASHALYWHTPKGKGARRWHVMSASADA